MPVSLVMSGIPYQHYTGFIQTFIAAHLYSVDDWNLLKAEAAECADVCSCQRMQPHVLVHCRGKQQRPFHVPRSYNTRLSHHSSSTLHCVQKTHHLWNTVARNCKDRFCWNLRTLINFYTLLYPMLSEIRMPRLPYCCLEVNVYLVLIVIWLHMVNGVQQLKTYLLTTFTVHKLSLFPNMQW